MTPARTLLVVPKQVQKKAGRRGRAARQREKAGHDPADLLKAWQKAIREVGGALASAPAGVASDIVGPLQHQADLVQQVLQRQLEFEREVLNRATAPFHTTLELMDQATETLRAQAISFRAASTTFHQLASLMDQQADVLHRAGATMRDPLGAFRSTDE
jgi:ABC-type transporter Mla subunit MlaD